LLPEPLKYNDLHLRIIGSVIGAHIFTVYGEPESSLEWFFKKDYYPAFALSLFIAFILTSYIHYLTTRLDRKYDWQHHTIKRVLLQLLFGVAVPALFAFLVTGLYLRVRDVNILKTTYISHDFQYLQLLLILINAYYLAHFLYLRWQQAEQKAVSLPVTEEKATPPQMITVSRGSKNFPIAINDIAVIYRQDEVNYLRTFDAEKYFLPYTLDDLIQQLDQSFFRVNRQVIISRRALASYKNLDYGKIQLRLIDIDYQEPVVVSQKRAKGFREWVGK